MGEHVLRTFTSVVREILAFIIVALGFIGLHFYANDLLEARNTVSQLFDCDNPCIIKNNPGGNIYKFAEAAKALLSLPEGLAVVDGDCYSSCAVFADIAKAKVCITEQAVFWFHKGEAVQFSGWKSYSWHIDPPQSDEISQWVYERGGYRVKHFLPMRFGEAIRFWQHCDLNPPLPRSRPKELAHYEPPE